MGPGYRVPNLHLSRLPVEARWIQPMVEFINLVVYFVCLGPPPRQQGPHNERTN